GVLCKHRFPGADCVLQLVLSHSLRRACQAGITQDMNRLLWLATVDRNDSHARHTVHDLVHKPLRHETGAQNCNLNRVALGCARLQCLINNNHEISVLLMPGQIVIRRLSSGSICSSNENFWSFSEITVTGSGHRSPSRGSLYISPLSCSGA